ncbi:cytoplasmic fmr1-interacting protein-related [Anaeramoeba ignava]|uniref:Cytoplasmic fmr1-interacting protein-related n=1 Tax=Anaeramoeba ignava TaxID=1746090 RepID=A0A9Q0LTF8_ANAIG|nr:cytoplasmic fmr1-interacting protein-related [Anaeramoeba ignava]
MNENNFELITKSISSIQIFDNTPIEEENSPEIYLSLEQSNLHTDRKAYIETGESFDLSVLAEIHQVNETAKRLFAVLYAHRSILKSVLKITNEVKEKEALNNIKKANLELMNSVFKKAKDLMNFRDEATKFICETISNLKKRKEEIINRCILKDFGNLIDSYTVLDLLMNQKASFANDFSHFKREYSSGFEGGIEKAETLQEMHSLSLFLAKKYSLLSNLKENLLKITGYDDFFEMLIMFMLELYESKRIILPDEKRRYLRIISVSLVLMGDPKNEKTNPFKSKGLPLSKIGKIFKESPFILLYGDMSVGIEQILSQSTYFSSSIWGSLEENHVVEKYMLINHIDNERNAYDFYVFEFIKIINPLKAKIEKKQQLSDDEISTWITFFINGLGHICKWTSQILEQSAYKYTHAIDSSKCPIGATEYERAVRYNYSDKELSTLLEYISMVKALSSLLQKETEIIFSITRKYIYRQIQKFAQNTIRPILRRLTKKKKTKLRNSFLLMRTIFADWSDGKEPDDISVQAKNQKIETSIQTKTVGITFTQNITLQIILETLRSVIGKKGEIINNKELTGGEIKDLEEFENLLWIFPYLLNYVDIIQVSSNFSHLWFRELYLELTNNIQFPVEFSLPWILARHSLSMRTSHLSELSLYPLSLYNDAAEQSLNFLEQQYLFEEIEAEVNLCFDQLVFQLGEEIFHYYKYLASTMMIDNEYRAEIRKIDNKLDRLIAPKTRYQTLLMQRHVTLLGRTVNFSNLLTQKINNILRENINAAIQIFESSDATGIIQLDEMLQSIQNTHNLLSQYLFLDSFENMLSEINESTSLVSLQNRITLHFLFELVEDIIPNFVFNSTTQRFLRAPRSFVHETLRDPPPKVPNAFLYGSKTLNEYFENINRLRCEFFGAPHIISFLKVSGEKDLPLIVQECLTNSALKTQNILAPYVEELLSGISTKTNLPSLDYGIDGCFGYFVVPLDVIRQYEELEPGVFQNFRELGNTIALMRLFEHVIPVMNFQTFINSAPFVGVVPPSKKKINKDKKDDDNDNNDNDDDNTLLFLDNAVQNLTLKNDNENILKSSLAAKDLLSFTQETTSIYSKEVKPMSLFKAVLEHTNKMLDPVRDKWLGDTTPGLFNISRSNEFYRLWSCLQFMFCLPPDEKTDPKNAQKTFTYQQLFGDGIAWAGATIIYFLNQRELFNSLDFSYHILYANSVLKDKATKQEHLIFLENAKYIQDLNNTIFSLLDFYYPVQNSLSYELEPPTDEEIQKIQKDLLGTQKFIN